MPKKQKIASTKMKKTISPKKKAMTKKPMTKKPITKKTPAKKTPTKKVVASVKKPKTGKTVKLAPRDRKIQEIKKYLIGQKKILLLGALEARNELPEQTVFPDLGDQASAEIDRNFMLKIKGRERKLIKKIEEAVERIDEGIFGICDKCGEEIDIRRLEARPVTTMCIECKTVQEEEEKLREG
ncbi:MAG: TraR/DksA C4-type zinc finger protein [Thermodesulfovibrionales bacterium]|nr:TraR/DksA C4-type zinc finger protein [Thermodesulfovibrionales bacterium]